jgi:hypothetical protein
LVFVYFHERAFTESVEAAVHDGLAR